MREGVIHGGVEGLEPKWRVWSKSEGRGRRGGRGAKVWEVLAFLPESVTALSQTSLEKALGALERVYRRLH